VSIVLACLNEEGHLAASVAAIDRTMGQTRYSYELVFVDDGSRDRTRAIIQGLCDGRADRRYLFHAANIGRGGAVSDGLRAARGELAGFIDIDLEVHCRYIPGFLLELERGHDVVCGYRVYRMKLTPGNLVRHLVSVAYRGLTRLSLRLPLRDTEAGFKFFRRSTILPLLDRCVDQHWFWDTEIVARAVAEGLSVDEIPVVFTRRADKQSTVRVVRDSWRHFRALVRFMRSDHARPA
jgi:glycosyltransferase involved in cell wall biosynthesis